MMRGINRQVVEISEPESAYFEKVIFFVRPEYCGMSEAVMRAKANGIIKEKENPPAMKKAPGKRFPGVLKTLIAAVLSAAATAMIFLIFH